MNGSNAGLTLRFTALLSDIVGLLLLLCPLLPACGWGIIPLLFLTCTSYLAVIDAYSSHCSLGKKLMGIRVTDSEGNAISPTLSLIRAVVSLCGLTLVFFLDVIGILIWILGLIYAKKNEGNLPHDIWTHTRTIVVRKPFLHPLLAQVILTFALMGILFYLVFIAIKLQWISRDFYEQYFASGSASGRALLRY
jgi:uncharacterized RDD family membrane protein YckC